MNTPHKILARMAGAGALVFLAHTAQSQILYDNATVNLGQNFNYTGEAGNEIVLAGASANDTVTGFAFQFDYSGSSSSPAATADVTFYKNNGAIVDGYASPSTAVWSSGAFSLGGYTPADGSTVYFTKSDFGGGVVVPKDFTWTVTFAGLQDGESAGLAEYGPAPTVGSNFGDVWLNDGWSLVTLPNEGPLEFGAIVSTSAVPDSSCLPLSVMAVMAGFGWMKRFQARK